MRFHARYEPHRRGGGCLTVLIYFGALIAASQVGMWLVWALIAVLVLSLIVGALA